MLKWEGRDVPETLAEVVDPTHTVVIMHDIQNDNTGPEGVFAKAGRRIDVTAIVDPIAQIDDGVAAVNGCSGASLNRVRPLGSAQARCSNRPASYQLDVASTGGRDPRGLLTTPVAKA